MGYEAVRARRGDPLPHLREVFTQGLQDIIEGRRPPAPLHVEIHPHHSSTPFCNNACEGCTGGHYRTLPGAATAGIDPSRLIATIHSFEGRTKEAVFSGNCTETLLYPWIVNCINACHDANVKCSVYSNFYHGDKEGLIEALTSPRAIHPYVRASLDAGSEESYRKAHSPSDPHAYSKIVRNIERLVQAKKERSSDLFVHITYLVSRYNMADEELRSTAHWASRIGVDCIRFTTYQKPLGRPMTDACYLEEADLGRVKTTLERLRSKLDREEFKMMPMFDEMDRQQKPKDFRRCYVQDVFGVIGFDGGVYPCTAMAYADAPSYLRFGNINTEDFWDIWERKNHAITASGTLPGDFPLDKCYDCTRAERNVNVAIEEEKTKRGVISCLSER